MQKTNLNKQALESKRDFALGLAKLEESYVERVNEATTTTPISWLPLLVLSEFFS